MRQVVLDTETTGLSPEQGHRIIEIGAVELVERRLTGNDFHKYFQPDREIDPGATKVHGITNAFLDDKPHFADIAESLISYLQGAEVIIHNAPFDVAFINAEFARLSISRGTSKYKLEEICTITDTLMMAREKYPGQRNNLDALCKRYNIDQSQRVVHGALLDARLLANVYLAMTGGQVSLALDESSADNNQQIAQTLKNSQQLDTTRPTLRVVLATTEENTLHLNRLRQIDQKSNGQCLWLKSLP
ncbi:DNA polymerase III subunit epsilon [Achromatium sp. WMS1]|nr:DNA polymerase III subunit epsilon [Achromatium sp. WMS1]